MANFFTRHQGRQHNRLAELERVVSTHLEGFIQAGTALAEIRDEQLYRNEYPTFAEYLESRWGMTARRAYQLIAAASAAENVKHASLTPNARQAEELAKAPFELQPTVWDEVIAAAGDTPVTAALVKETIGKTRKKRSSKRPPKPTRIRVPGAIVIIERRSADVDVEKALTDALGQIRSRAAA